MFGILRHIQGWAKIKGGSDGTFIGNVDDKIKTVSSFSPEALTAFGRQKTSVPTVIFEANFVENDGSRLFDNDTTGGGSVTHNTTSKQIDLSCGTASGDSAIIQSFRRIKYTPGQSDDVIIVQKLNTKANVRSRCGLFDSSDGVYFEHDGSTLGVCIRNSISASTNRISQSNWNIDTLDGTGPSGKTIDLTKVQIFYIDFQWLGAGSVRFGVFIDGELVFCHKENHANVISASKYMRTATLPIRWEIENTGTAASATTLEASCCSVINEGVTLNPQTVRSIANDNFKSIPSNGNREPLVSIRLKSSSDIANLRPKSFSFLSETADEIEVQLILGGNLTGGSWVSVDSTSSADANLTATDHTGGIILYTALVKSKSDANIDLPITDGIIGKAIDGTPQEIHLVARTLNNAASGAGALVWEEIY